ncbi:MAG: nucleoside kinase [Lachnospiraceae bacterium]|jgi:uridine kinase|nr:nucleoside kinase [Lachnospiraceae bacterium]
MIQIQMAGEPARLYPSGISWQQIAAERERGPAEAPIMCVESGHQLYELSESVKRDCTGKWITLSDIEGYRIYVRTLLYLFITSAQQVLGRDKRAVVLHSLGGNLYIEVRQAQETYLLSERQIGAILAKMRQLVRQNEPIHKQTYTMDDAMNVFAEKNRQDKKQLLHYRASSNINLYSLCSEKDYFYGGMLPSAGALQWFNLIPYEEGVMLITPQRTAPYSLRSFTPQPKLFGVFQQSKRWSRILQVENVGALNECIASGEIENLVQISEALHAKQIAEMASRIAGKQTVKLVLVAGPSSSGKTTFAQKLGIQLRAEGMRPHLISMDNYFINRDEVPFGEDGLQDFEALEAVDTALFNVHMQQLLEGRSVELPVYNFKTGKREFRGDILKLGDADVLIVEGIHCLNEEVSKEIPKAQKFKIYISAITMLNIDDHNRIPTTDGRLLRRMVRDYQHRATSAADTIRRWPSVRNGEERNIFPFQEAADEIFNSAHIYELAVLKTYAEPLLFKIQKEEPEYKEARRLIKFLDYFLSVSSEVVPEMSIIREFIGGGIYRQ